MCGIVGFVGNHPAQEVLINGLKKLEYRGYDSAGIYIIDEDGEGHLFRVKGRIEDLKKKVDFSIPSHIGIGHTRWATHGEPSVRNAHPQLSSDGQFALVHNGVIENYQELKAKYLPHHQFVSETDTEVVVELIDYFYKEGLETKEAFRAALKELEGSYAFALINSDDPDTIYAAKNQSPLLIGKGDDFNAVASDAMATIAYTNQYVEINDQEMVTLTADGFDIETIDGEPVERGSYTAEIDANDTEKGIYPYYMAKEISEQPVAIRNIIQKYSDPEGQLTVRQDIIDAVKDCDEVFIVGAGTSYHAGLVGANLLEKVAKVPTRVSVASEFSYNPPIFPEKPFFIYLSQSGETADLRSVLVKTNRAGYPSLTITNVQGSTLARESTYALYLHVGPEIAVASTKAYTGQIAVLAIIADAVAKEKGITVDFDLKLELGKAAQAIEGVIEKKEQLHQLAHDYFDNTRSAFYIGRGLDYYVSLEAALKLKEISYTQTEGFAAGELKHGTISLIEDGVPVVAIITQEEVAPLTRGNLEEVKSRGAHTMVISMDGLNQSDDEIVIPQIHPYLTPLVSVVPCQILAYYTALDRGLDVDKPRNLAKSVTVE